ncbi:hypothetical protein ACGF12_34335 [Kitasatospora sp. NPDC048296]|uniref:hypothetical protein n=1 Tax=Kitasatospora sp. NPDC048296 TaxID=3364048 RepID=UPI00371081C1
MPRPTPQRPPSKRASAALIAACAADYRQSQDDAARKPPDPFKFAPLMWEYHQQNGTGVRRVGA